MFECVEPVSCWSLLPVAMDHVHSGGKPRIENELNRTMIRREHLTLKVTKWLEIKKNIKETECFERVRAMVRNCPSNDSFSCNNTESTTLFLSDSSPTPTPNFQQLHFIEKK